ncbi:hypothetical protein CPB86DRAFT_795707 [Serendipita vermifera]|nr:hypothetical protein CPB86DRAFT_795707 [Serendipita vermifera]
MSTSAGSSKRKAEDDYPEDVANTKKPKRDADEEESGSDEEVSGDEGSDDDFDEDELADLIQDQEDSNVGYTGGRRTRGVKIDFTNKRLPGEKEGEIDDDDDEDDDEGNAKTKEEEEEVVEGKGKGKAVVKPTSKVGGEKPTSKVGGGSKPASKA